MANRKTSHIPILRQSESFEGIWFHFRKVNGVGNARVSVMAACGQARDGVVEAVLTCQVRHPPSFFILTLNFSLRFNFQGDIDDPDFPDRCQKMFNRLSHVLDNSKYLVVNRSHLVTTSLPRRARCDQVRAVELCEGDVQPAQGCSGKARPARTVWRRSSPRARDPLLPNGGRPGEQPLIWSKPNPPLFRSFQ